MIGGIAAGDARGAAAGRGRGLLVRHRRVRRAVRRARGRRVRPSRRRPRRARRRAGERRLPVPPRRSCATRCSTTSRPTAGAASTATPPNRLIELGASAARIGHHLLESGAAADAVPYLLRAAETEAAVGAYRDALALVDAVRPHATGSRPGDRAVAARRPAQRDRRPDGGRRPTGRRSTAPTTTARAAFGSGSRAPR